MPEHKTVLAKAKAWAAKNKLLGSQAFFRYVIFCFAENLNRVSDDFVFKGGNLLWVYIATPRATTDLDFATIESDSHSQVRKALESACAVDGEIHFSIASFKEVTQGEKRGCVVTIKFSTAQGATNQFDIDIVYAIDANNHKIASPVHHEVKIRSATIENIIADKLIACHRFKAGNTRMKDLDDLWRLSQSEVPIKRARLMQLLRAGNVEASVDPKWLNHEFERAWKSHRKRYPDLPESLAKLFKAVNDWLGKI